MPAMTETVADPIRVARSALERHDWAASFEQYTAADATGRLAGADLEGFAQAAFFLARADLELEIKERAFKAYEAAGDTTVRTPGDRHRARVRLRRQAGDRLVWARRAERIIGPDERLATSTGISRSSSSEAARASGRHGAGARPRRYRPSTSASTPRTRT